MAMEFKFGLTEPAMKAIGNPIKHVEKENFGMWMEMYLKDNGKTIRQMDMERTSL